MAECWPHLGVNWISVTVRASNACDADALTKIVWALDPNAEELVRDHRAEDSFTGRGEGRHKMNACGPTRLPGWQERSIYVGLGLLFATGIMRLLLDWFVRVPG